jgi:hypothetical protein
LYIRPSYALGPDVERREFVLSTIGDRPARHRGVRIPNHGFLLLPAEPHDQLSTLAAIHDWKLARENIAHCLSKIGSISGLEYCTQAILCHELSHCPRIAYHKREAGV